MLVMNYPPDKYKLRGINLVGEWGRTAQGEWFAMGRNPSEGSSITALPKVDPADYFADTSFRVVQDAPDETMNAKDDGQAHRPAESAQDVQPDETSGLSRETNNRHHHH